MKMEQLMELIEQEKNRSGLSAEKFANLVGVTSTTFSRQTNIKQDMEIKSVRAYARYAKQVRNSTLLQALGAYALGLEPDEISVNTDQPA